MSNDRSRHFISNKFVFKYFLDNNEGNNIGLIKFDRHGAGMSKQVC